MKHISLYLYPKTFNILLLPKSSDTSGYQNFNCLILLLPEVNVGQFKEDGTEPKEPTSPKVGGPRKDEFDPTAIGCLTPCA